MALEPRLTPSGPPGNFRNTLEGRLDLLMILLAGKERFVVFVLGWACAGGDQCLSCDVPAPASGTVFMTLGGC